MKYDNILRQQHNKAILNNDFSSLEEYKKQKNILNMKTERISNLEIQMKQLLFRIEILEKGLEKINGSNNIT